MGCVQWKSSIPGAVRGKTNINRQEGGCHCQGRGQSHQQASAFVFQEASLFPSGPDPAGFALGKLPGKLEWGWFVSVWKTKGKMCSAGQEVTHQDPCSRGQGRSKHPEEKHETEVLEQGEEGKNSANTTPSLGHGGRVGETGIATLHPGAADTEPEGQVHPAASASL